MEYNKIPDTKRERDSTLSLDSLEDILDIVNVCNTFIRKKEHEQGLDVEDGY